MIMGVAALALILTACHTTEENYKKAYDIALQKKVESIGEEEYAKIEAEKTRATTVIAGDSVRLLRRHANVVGEEKDFKVPKYGVVVAEFKQSLNALTYRDRLRSEELHPSYVLLEADTKKYLVVVKGFEERVAASSFLHDAQRHVKMKILVTPWIIEKL